MTLSKSFEKYLKQIVKEAVVSAQHTPSAPDQSTAGTPHSHDGHHHHGSNDEDPTSGEEDRFWKIKEAPEKEDDEEIYCSTFDGMAEAHVEELTDGLNNQLDNLLLFAALFSGINSAFIVFSLPNLANPFQGMELLLDVLIESGNNATAVQLSQKILDSQNSSTTLNVAVNVLFASSLICSLITAFFAVVGKQWLSYLAEEPGDSDERTRRMKMQNKVIGIQRYKLRDLLDAYLTTTIQIALFLFMVGLILFLYTFNNIVTWVVIGFVAAGMLAYTVSAALALRDPACPFQTPITRTLLPHLFSISFDTVYTVWALVNSLIILLTKPNSKPAQAQGKQQDLDTVPQPEWDDSAGKQRDSDDVFEIQWDRRYALRRNLAAKLQFKPKEGRVNIEAACWMIQTAEHEMAARVAALMILNLTEREDLGFVATYKQTTRRLRDVISVTDEVLKHQANNSADIKEREWKKLCFYVQVLSHIFAGETGMDSAQCQVMDWIYQYQKNKNRNKNDHAYTCVPARMVGVIKLLLLHFDRKHYSIMTREREKCLRLRLYHAPYEPDCSSKALSLAAFAMKTLPHVASKERDQTTGRQLREDLWHSYLENDPGVLRSNLVGAIATYADLVTAEAVRDILPSAGQLQKLWQCIARKGNAKACLPTGKAKAEVTHTVRPLQQEGHISDCNVFVKGEVEDTASLAEACFRLAETCSNEPVVFAANGKDDESWESAAYEDINAVQQIVYDIWTVCHGNAVRYASEEPPSSPAEAIHCLRTATALLRAADPKLASPPLESITDDQRKSIDSFGLRWIKTVADTLKAEELAKDLFFTSPEAMGAISFFLQHSAEIEFQGSPPELDFAGNYVLLCQERGLGDSESVKRLGGAVASWRNSLEKSD